MTRFVVAGFLTLLAGASVAGPFDNLAGTWRGQAEYRAKVKAVEDPAAHAVVDLFLQIEPGGKVVGRSPENGCQLLGLAKQSTTSTNFKLDVTVSGCAVETLNGRYPGQIAVYPKKGNITLALQMNQPGVLGRPSRWGQITSTLVR